MHSSSPTSRKQFKLQGEELAFVNKKDHLPLQAADILAYELYQHLPRDRGEVDHSPRFRHLAMLGRVKLSVWQQMTDEVLRDWITRLDLAVELRSLG